MLAHAPDVAYTTFATLFAALGFLPLAAMRAQLGPRGLLLCMGFTFSVGRQAHHHHRLHACRDCMQMRVCSLCCSSAKHPELQSERCADDSSSCCVQTLTGEFAWDAGVLWSQVLVDGQIWPVAVTRPYVRELQIKPIYTPYH